MKFHPEGLGVCAAALCMSHCVVFPLPLAALPPVGPGGQMHQYCLSAVESNPNHQSFA